MYVSTFNKSCMHLWMSLKKIRVFSDCIGFFVVCVFFWMLISTSVKIFDSVLFLCPPYSYIFEINFILIISIKNTKKFKKTLLKCQQSVFRFYCRSKRDSSYIEKDFISLCTSFHRLQMRHRSFLHGIEIIFFPFGFFSVGFNVDIVKKEEFFCDDVTNLDFLWLNYSFFIGSYWVVCVFMLMGRVIYSF